MRCYIGYSRRDHDAYEVCKFSILKHSPKSKVFPIVQDQLRADGIYRRGRDLLDSTGFSTTRYLTPFLAGYEGYALYADCDVLFTRDVEELLRFPAMENVNNAVWIVKHRYFPRPESKSDARKQVLYPRKNWSSVMLMNCSHPLCRALTPDFVNISAIPVLNELRFAGDFIGELPIMWNFLVGEYHAPDAMARTMTKAMPVTPAALHFTRGSANWIPDVEAGDYDQLWATYKAEMNELSTMHLLTS